MKKGIRKQIYIMAKTEKLNKESNTYNLIFGAFLMIVLVFGSFSQSFLTHDWQHTLSIFYSVVLFCLLMDRIFWNMYFKSKIAGLFEAISVYSFSFLAIYLLCGVFDLALGAFFFVVFFILTIFLILFFLGAWYEAKNISDRKIILIMVSIITIGSLIAFGLYALTSKDLFLEIGFVMLSCFLSLHIVPYFFVMDFPYKRKLYKEFGPKSISKSSIFVNKKKK